MHLTGVKGIVCVLLISLATCVAVGLFSVGTCFLHSAVKGDIFALGDVVSSLGGPLLSY